MKVLVTAATRHSATTEIAAAIARVLRLRGLETVELPPGEVDDVDGYDAVVLGSAVYLGRWLDPATALVRRCLPEPSDTPVWLFSSGPIGVPPKASETPDLSEIVAATGAVEHRVFAGKLDRAELGLLERTMVRAVHAPEGDYRDWAEVSHWAAQIADALAASTTR